MDVALEALRQRYQFEGFHLFGESGGGRLVFGLAQMRRDVACLISGSGQIVTRGPPRPGDPGKDLFRHHGQGAIARAEPRLAHDGYQRPE